MEKTIANLNLSANVRTSLEEVGLSDSEVTVDVSRVARGEMSRDVLLSECLVGCEGADRVAAWTEYVDAVVAAAEVSA